MHVVDGEHVDVLQVREDRRRARPAERTYIARRPAAVAARHAACSKWLLPAPSAPQSQTVSAPPLRETAHVLDGGRVAAR